VKNLEEIKQKDKELREKILSGNIDPIVFNGDYFLVKSIIELQTELLKSNREPRNKKEKYLMKYPNIFLHEWYVVEGMSQYGKGDLVFTDGNKKFLIVEVKELSLNSGRNQCVARTKSRKKVKKQAINYMSAFRKKFPGAKSIKGAAVAGNEWKFSPFY